MKSKIYRLLSAFGLPSLLRNNKGEEITVLCLHKISDKTDFYFNPISRKQFEGLVEYCNKHYSIVTFSQIETITPKRKLIFSFDDGYYDFLEHAIPILDKFNAPSNHNIVNICANEGATIWTQKLVHLNNFFKENHIKEEPSLVDLGLRYENSWLTYGYSITNLLMSYEPIERDQLIENLLKKYQIIPEEKMMTWDDILLCEREYKVEIGSHTYTHRTLNQVTKMADLEFEITQSIDEIQIKLGHKIDVFCLPRGQYNQTVLDFLKEKTSIKFVLLVHDDTNANQIDSFNLMNRVYMIHEPVNEMILRTELFQNTVKKIIRRP